MHLRRSTALALGTALLLALTGCGFNYATDRVYTPAMGANNHDTGVDVLGAVIVSADDNAGSFIATFSNNDRANSARVVSLAAGESADPADPADLKVGDFTPVTIPAGGLVNLATEGGLPVTGTFRAGDFLPLTIGFGDGSTVDMKVAVVTDDGYFDGLDGSGAAGSGSASPAA